MDPYSDMIAIRIADMAYEQTYYVPDAKYEQTSAVIVKTFKAFAD